MKTRTADKLHKPAGLMPVASEQAPYVFVFAM